MKKILLAILILVVTLVIATSVVASSNELPLLSELSDEECLLFLEKNGIAMPSAFSDEGTWIYFARSVIIKVEEDPNMVIPYNAFEMFWCASDIKDAVNAYYGVSGISTYATSNNNILEDNTVHGAWSEEYNLYTSYAYAIDYYVPFVSDRGELMWYDPGQIWWNLSGNVPAKYNFNRAGNVETIVDLVELDFEKLGYLINSVSTIMPNTSVDDHTKLICIRRDDDGLPPYENRSVETEEDRWHDYHFMKLGADGYWYHKPTITNPLKYNYVPTYDRLWVFESARGDPYTYERDTDYTYESEIWFIEYTTPHVWEYVFWESGQHIERCTICREERLADCQWGSVDYVGLNCHQFTCELCGGLGGNTACTRAYSHMYDETSGNHAHIEACTVCNYAGNLPENCTIAVTDNGDGTHTTACAVCGFSEVADCEYQCSYSGSGTTHTHTTTCSGCDHSETESCTFAIRYNGYVDGHNTHINACTECGYSPSGAVQCMYNSSGKCRLCGTFENYVPINREKEELLEA